jgi:hypothetical protein
MYEILTAVILIPALLMIYGIVKEGRLPTDEEVREKEIEWLKKSVNGGSEK